MSSNTKRVDNRVKVLLFIPNVMKRGGIETFLMSYFHNMNKSKITFIFCQMCFDTEKGEFDEEILKNGGFVEYLQFSNRRFLKSLKSLKTLLNKYYPDIIHVHGDADCTSLLFALRLCKSKNVICHSHNTNSSSNRGRLLLWFKRRLSARLCDYRFACSSEAGRWLFGKKQYYLIPNAIDTKKFAFSDKKRLFLRQMYDIPSNTIVVGCVGHILLKHKHQDYLVEIAKLAAEMKKSFVVCLVGGGADLEQLKQHCLDEKIDNVIFTGEISNTNDYYSMFDVLALPSYYEGLGITCVEGICSGLFAIVSDKVPLINGDCDRELQIPTTSESSSMWLDELCERAKTRYFDGEQYIEKIGYSIEKECKNLFEHYQKIVSN